MGVSYKVHFPIFLDELPGPPAEVLAQTVEILESHGVRVTDEDGNELVEHLPSGGTEGSESGDPFAAVVEEATSEGGAWLRLDYGEGLNSQLGSVTLTDDEWSSPRLGLYGPDKYALRERDVSRADARERVETVAAIVKDLAVALDPWLVVARLYSDHQTEWPTFPEGKPPDSGIEELAWANVFGEVWFDQFGGRERMLDVPAYEVEELENGSVYVRTEEIPGHFQPDAEGPDELSAYEYLFEGKSRAELEAELESRKSTYVDPFRELDVGELGSDAVVCQDHADFDLPELDYRHVPPKDEIDPCGIVVCRRDEDGLWDATAGTFVRRLIGEDGTPMGELPKGVAPEEEFVSREVGTVQSDPVGVDMIEMDDPDDESLLMQVYGIFWETEEDTEERDDATEE